MSANSVPFADLGIQHLALKRELEDAIARVIANSAFVRGPEVEQFEVEYAELMKAKHCVSCANGTDALYIAMHALGIRPGDEVITTAQSWISTSATISQHGAVPIFIDIDPVTNTIDAARIEERITERTVGIIPVHLYGQPADMPAILKIAQANSLWVIEDCAQAHLATVGNALAGQSGTIATWSFYPGKNLGALGDAGAATTNDPALARKMARFARHGGLVKGIHEIEGINSRLDGLQAALLRVKLPHLAKWTAQRQAAADRYSQLLADIPGLELPQVASDRTHAYHLYVVQHDQRDDLAAHLKNKGIATAIHYQTALPFLPAYRRFGHVKEQFPVVTRQQGRILSLPMFAEITADQQTLVANAIGDFCAAV